jgi:hypothetical protein
VPVLRQSTLSESGGLLDWHLGGIGCCPGVTSSHRRRAAKRDERASSISRPISTT